MQEKLSDRDVEESALELSVDKSRQGDEKTESASAETGGEGSSVIVYLDAAAVAAPVVDVPSVR